MEKQWKRIETRQNTTAAVWPKSHSQSKKRISADVSIYETGLGAVWAGCFH